MGQIQGILRSLWSTGGLGFLINNTPKLYCAYRQGCAGGVMASTERGNEGNR